MCADLRSCQQCASVPVLVVPANSPLCQQCQNPCETDRFVFCNACIRDCAAEVARDAARVGTVDDSYFLCRIKTCFTLDSCYSDIDPGVLTMHAIGSAAASDQLQYHPDRNAVVHWERYKELLIAQHLPGVVFSIRSDDITRLATDPRFTCRGATIVAHTVYPDTPEKIEAALLALFSRKHRVGIDELCVTLKRPAAELRKRISDDFYYDGAYVTPRPTTLARYYANTQ